MFSDADECSNNDEDFYRKPLKRDWVARVVFLIQILLIFGGLCNRSFWDIRLKIQRLPNFNMLFQFLLTKFFKSWLFSCLKKVDHVTNYCKRPITLANNEKNNFHLF